MIRKIAPDRTVTTFAGSGSSGSFDGVGTGATFRGPSGIAIDPYGNLIVTEFDNSIIRQVSAARVVSTLGGVAESFGWVDGLGTAARFRAPAQVVRDPTNGNIYITEYDNNTIRKGVPPPDTLPSFSQEPGHFTVYEGNNATFNVFATGFPAPTFQWQSANSGAGPWTDLVDGASYSGTQTPFLTVIAAPLSLNGKLIRCVITNTVGSVASGGQGGIWATLTVEPRPGITTVAGYNSSGNQDGVGTVARFRQPFK